MVDKHYQLVIYAQKQIAELLVLKRLRTDNVGRGFFQDLSSKRGAIASSVSHDSHNLIMIRVND
jgi:adenine deaminase